MTRGWGLAYASPSRLHRARRHKRSGRRDFTSIRKESLDTYRSVIALLFVPYNCLFSVLTPEGSRRLMRASSLDPASPLYPIAIPSYSSTCVKTFLPTPSLSPISHFFLSVRGLVCHGSAVVLGARGRFRLPSSLYSPAISSPWLGHAFSKISV